MEIVVYIKEVVRPILLLHVLPNFFLDFTTKILVLLLLFLLFGFLRIGLGGFFLLLPLHRLRLLRFRLLFITFLVVFGLLGL